MSRSLVLSSIAVCAALTAPARADQPAPAPAATYVVQDGDSCMSIAVNVLGDRRQLRALHRLNPQLGKLPHLLHAGQVLTLPGHHRSPDARLTGKSGDVRFRTAADPAWDAATRGMDLFRAWRVGAEPRASAQVTFRDTQQLALRENTVVIIYGPELRRVRGAAPEAVLEHGTLRTRLAELSGKAPPPITVTTPSARATVGQGSAVIGVDDDGRSMVANHDGRAIDLRGTGGGRVAVKSGMGTRVAKDKPPEKPRKLPPAPTWIAGASRFVAVDGQAALRGAWTPVKSAASYRFEVLHGALVVASGQVPATVTALVVERTPPGDYRVQVASIDADGLEGKPNAALVVAVRAVAIADPGADAPTVPTVPTASADDEPIDTSASAPLRPVAIGARVIAGPDLTCAAGGLPAAVTVLTATGATEVQCTAADGTAFAPFVLAVDGIEVAASSTTAATVGQGQTIDLEIALRSRAALGEGWQLEPSPGLTVDHVTRTAEGLHARVGASDDAPATGTLRVVDTATQRTAGEVALTITARPDEVASIDEPARPRARRDLPITVGAFGGGLLVSSSGELGNAAVSGYAPESGAAVGLRAAGWLRHRFFVETEGSVTPTRFAASSELVWVFGGHAYLGARVLAHRALTLRVLAGGGFYALRSDSPFVADDVDLDASYGVAGVYQLGHQVRLRLDGRHHLVPDRSDDRLGSAFELSAGVELELSRR